MYNAFEQHKRTLRMVVWRCVWQLRPEIPKHCSTSRPNVRFTEICDVQVVGAQLLTTQRTHTNTITRRTCNTYMQSTTSIIDTYELYNPIIEQQQRAARPRTRHK